MWGCYARCSWSTARDAPSCRGPSPRSEHRFRRVCPDRTPGRVAVAGHGDANRDSAVRMRMRAAFECEVRCEYRDHDRSRSEGCEVGSRREGAHAGSPAPREGRATYRLCCGCRAARLPAVADHQGTLQPDRTPATVRPHDRDRRGMRARRGGLSPEHSLARNAHDRASVRGAR